MREERHPMSESERRPKVGLFVTCLVDLIRPAVGFAAVGAISRIVTARTDILVSATLGWPEFHFVAAFVSLTVILALTPAFMALSRNIITDLRA